MLPVRHLLCRQVAESDANGQHVEFVLGERLRTQAERIPFKGRQARLNGDVDVLFNRVSTSVFYVE